MKTFIHQTLSLLQVKILANHYWFWNLKHWWGRALLWLLTWVDTALYNMNRLEFGELRRQRIGPFFGGLGRLICVDYHETRRQTLQPQKRGPYIGRLHFRPDVFSPQFLLFLDNTPNGNHSLYHNHLVRWVFNQRAHLRLQSNHLQLLVQQLCQSITLPQPRSQRHLKPLKVNGSCQVDFDTEPLEGPLLDILFYLFLNLELTDPIRQDLQYLAGISHPMGPRYLTQRIAGKIDSERERRVIEYMMGSDIWNDYQPPQDQEVGVGEMSELMLNGLLVAGFLGTFNALLASLSVEIHGEGLEFGGLPRQTKGYQNYLLEVMRMFAPVNFLNTVLPDDTYFLIDGKEYLFPSSTIVAFSLLNSGYDPNGPFDKPTQFNPNRTNMDHNTIHFQYPGLGRDEMLNNRGCPARFLVLNLLSKILNTI